MIFNSPTFLLFIAIVLAMYNAPIPWRQKKIILLWVSTVIDWWAAQWMVRSKRQSTRRLWMIVSVVVNLGMPAGPTAMAAQATR